jgi:CheY-like chemotaxis protein
MVRSAAKLLVFVTFGQNKGIYSDDATLIADFLRSVGAANRASAGRLDLKLPKTDRLQALRQVKTDKNLKIIPVVALNLDLQPANLA